MKQPTPALAIMITPNADPDAASESSETQCVPLAALNVEETPPTVGDDVEYTVRGKVAKIEGEHAYVTPETINDQPATAPKPGATEPSDESVMDAAQKADDEGGGY